MPTMHNDFLDKPNVRLLRSRVRNMRPGSPLILKERKFTMGGVQGVHDSLVEGRTMPHNGLFVTITIRPRL